MNNKNAVVLAGDYAYIPFCVDGTCKSNTWEQKGKLDVNYCSE